MYVNGAYRCGRHIAPHTITYSTSTDYLFIHAFGEVGMNFALSKHQPFWLFLSSMEVFTMLYDNIYMLGDLFHRFLLDHPDIQEGSVAGPDVDLIQRFEDWLERETHVADLTHKATLLQMVSTYEALVDMRDTLTTSTGL
jgi:hypothetical protein